MASSFAGVELVEVEELAQALGCCRKTVLRLLARHRVPTVRNRRGYLVSARAWRRAMDGEQVPHADHGALEELHRNAGR